MPSIKLILCFILTCTISACANYTTIRQHKDFTKIFPKYRLVAIIPTEIFITKQTKNGQKFVMPGPARISNITKMAQVSLTKKGYDVTETITEYDDESASGDELNKEYKRAVSSLYGDKQKNTKEAAFLTNENLGRIAAKFPLKSKPDLIMVLGYSGTEMTQELVTKSLAKDVALSSIGIQNETHIKDGSAFISLIDRHDGKILWTNMGSDFENYGKSVARLITKNNVMETAFENALKDLPDKSK